MEAYILMKKPTSIKIVHVTLIIKLVLSLLLLLLLVLSLSLNNDAGKGMMDGLQITNLDTYNMSKYVTQIIAIPLILVILSLVFLNKRMYKALIVIFIIQLLSSIPSIPALLLVIVQLSIITLNSNAKNYFKPINKVSN